MSAPFKVGDVVIGQHFIYDTEKNGQEGVIVEGLEFGSGLHIKTFTFSSDWRYKVEWNDGRRTRVLPLNLRRRKPPAADSNERTHMQRWRDMAGKAPQRVSETV